MEHSGYLACFPCSCIVRGDEVSSAVKGQDKQVLGNACVLYAFKEMGSSVKVTFQNGDFPQIILEFLYLKKLFLEPELHDMRK